MIDTLEQTTCKACGQPLPQVGGKGHRKRQFCDDTCRQRHHRQQHRSNVVTIEDTQRIAELEAEREQAMQGLDQVQQRFAEYVRTTNEKLSQQAGDSRNLKRIEQYAMDCSLGEQKAKEQVAALEQELTRYRQIVDLSDRKRLEQQFMDIGEQIHFKSFLPSDTRPAIGQGPEFWRSFAEYATDEELAQGIARAKYYAENLIAIDTQVELQQAKRRIAELERQVTQVAPPDDTRLAELEQVVSTLQARLNVEERFRTDTQVRHFKSWLRKHSQPGDTDFANRFILDSRLPHHASRAMYEAQLRMHKYSEEDLHLFREAWKSMLFNQS